MAQARRIAFPERVSVPPPSGADRADQPPASSHDANRSGFAVLDSCVCTSASAAGVFQIDAAPHVGRAALQHLARRLRAQGRPVLYGERTPARPAFADLFERNGLGPATDARSVLRVLDAHRQTVFLLAGIEPDSWDATILDELEPDLLVLSGRHTVRSAAPIETIALQETLTAEGRALWLEGMCAELEASAPADLASLDSWLARTVHVAQAAGSQQHECAAEALAVLAAVGRPVPRAVVAQRLGEHLARECLAHGVREDASGLYFPAGAAPADGPARSAAALLVEAFPTDAWALGRAATLFLQVGDPAAALAAVDAALAAAPDPASRR
ncbi:MAG: hypothetical protein EOO75_09065, partial [Myxococcales bacterium]